MIGNGMVANGIGAAQPVRRPFAGSPEEGSQVSTKMTIVGVPMTALPAPLVRFSPPPIPFLRSLNTRLARKVTRNIVERLAALGARRALSTDC